MTGHWRGIQGFAWSFWVNLVGLRLVLFAAQEISSPAKGQDYHDSRWIVLGLALSVHGLVFVWQAVGVIRASELHVRASGAMAPVWGAQIVLAVAVFWVLAYMHDAWQMALPVGLDREQRSESAAARALKYSIEPADGGRTLELNGSLELGITAHLRAQLAAFPATEQIVLTSAGGNVFEARGLSNVIREAGLDTLVVSECSSACTTAFIGGVRRDLAGEGRLGFHQYRIEADYAVLAADPARQQDRDREIFLAAGVAAWFLDRMFDASATSMWYPDRSELLAAGVVTQSAPLSGEH